MRNRAGQADFLDASVTPADVVSPGMRSLVARANDLRRARSLIGSPGVVVFVGASGIGKTALCDALAAEWREKGGRSFEVRGTHGLGKIPFGALALSLRVAPTESLAGTLSELAATLTGTPPTLVVVDDAHLLDPQSSAVVGGLCQTDGLAVAIAATSGESIPADITSIWARWPDCRLELEPLSRDEVGEMMAGLIGRPSSSSLIDETWSLTLGYPLYVAAVAAELSAQLESNPEIESLESLQSSSGRLVSLMERRFARLDREERRLFDVVAFAESVPVGGLSSDENVLNRLEEKGLVRVVDMRAQVAHPLLGNVARDSLTPDGRRAAAARLLEMVADGGAPEDVLNAVRRAMRVGHTPDVESLRTAAEVALGWRDYAGVVQIAAKASDDSQLVVLHAQASRFLGEIPPLGHPVDLDDGSLTDYLSATSQALAYSERRFSDAIEFLKDGMASVVEPENRERLAMELMILSGLVGDMDALLGAARTVAGHDDANTRLLAISATQLAEALTLSTSTSEETYERGRVLWESGDVDGILREQLEMSRVMVDMAEGNFFDARTRAAAYADKTLLGSWLTVESVMADAWLPIEEASAVAASAVAALEEFDPLANLAQARIVADLRRAQLREGLDYMDTVNVLEPGVVAIDQIMGQRVDAWLNWAAEDQTAAKQLVEVGREAVAMGHRFWGLASFIDAVRLGHGTDVVGDIEHLAITRGVGLAVMAGRHARAESLEDLWSVARMWWRSGALTYAIEAAVRAVNKDRPLDGVGVLLMSVAGATPVVENLSSIEQPLSRRQLDIVARALAGESNDQIAEDLFLSRRTIENHLQRAYRALGVQAGRQGLMDALGWIQVADPLRDSSMLIPPDLVD